jgi:hypothetical protein
MSNCTLCGVGLDQPGKPETRDCGGDCLKCMAEIGDPNAKFELIRLSVTNDMLNEAYDNSLNDGWCEHDLTPNSIMCIYARMRLMEDQ